MLRTKTKNSCLTVMKIDRDIIIIETYYIYVWWYLYRYDRNGNISIYSRQKKGVRKLLTSHFIYYMVDINNFLQFHCYLEVTIKLTIGKFTLYVHRWYWYENLSYNLWHYRSLCLYVFSSIKVQKNIDSCSIIQTETFGFSWTSLFFSFLFWIIENAPQRRIWQVDTKGKITAR